MIVAANRRGGTVEPLPQCPQMNTPTFPHEYVLRFYKGFPVFAFPRTPLSFVTPEPVRKHDGHVPGTAI